MLTVYNLSRNRDFPGCRQNIQGVCSNCKFFSLVREWIFSYWVRCQQKYRKRYAQGRFWHYWKWIFYIFLPTLNSLKNCFASLHLPSVKSSSAGARSLSRLKAFVIFSYSLASFSSNPNKWPSDCNWWLLGTPTESSYTRSVCTVV